MRLIDADKLRTIRSIQKGDFNSIETIQKWIDAAPTVDAKPTEEQFEWCHDCKEYDQNAHCCHRWTKVIRNTVNDLKTQGYEPVRHGRWIDASGMILCSECGDSWGTETEEMVRSFNYCPNCGSKMDMEEQDAAD